MIHKTIRDRESSVRFWTQWGWLTTVLGSAFVTGFSIILVPDEKTVLKILVAVITAMTAITGYFARLIANFEHLQAKRHEEYVKLVEQILKDPVSYEEFDESEYYPRITETIRQAIEHSSDKGKRPQVWLTSFRSDSPFQHTEAKRTTKRNFSGMLMRGRYGRKKSEAEVYHELLRGWVKDSLVTVRRIIAVSDEGKVPWLLNMADTMNMDGYEMRLLKGVGSLRTVKQPSLNIQLVGHCHVYIVICSEESRAGDKFVYIKSKGLNEVLRVHYGNLWNSLAGSKIIEDSTVYDTLEKLVAEFKSSPGIQGAGN